MKSLKSNLKNVKNLGSAKDGTAHWWKERLTSIVLVPLSIWFVVLILKICNSSSEELYILLSSSFNVILMIIFISVGLYHGYMGIKVIIEDYVHKEKYKFMMIIIFQIITYLTIISGVSALLVHHFASMR